MILPPGATYGEKPPLLGLLYTKIGRLSNRPGYLPNAGCGRVVEWRRGPGGIEKPLEMSHQGLRFRRNRREVLIREADLVGDIAEFVV